MLPGGRAQALAGAEKLLLYLWSKECKLVALLYDRMDILSSTPKLFPGKASLSGSENCDGCGRTVFDGGHFQSDPCPQASRNDDSFLSFPGN